MVGDAILEVRRPFCEGSGTHENAGTARICQVVVRTRFFDIVKNECGSETGLTIFEMRNPSKSAPFLVIKQEGRLVGPSWVETPRPH